uniref:Uncharacterized protein n=1 Tax=Rhizophora mucronata TaxID=61149 RepID=A0A2P2NEL2_RHIMU
MNQADFLNSFWCCSLVFFFPQQLLINFSSLTFSWLSNYV